MSQSPATPELAQDTETQREVREPSMYLVFLLNDDFTPYEFVVGLVAGVFKHSMAASMAIAAQAHASGSALVGRYTKEIAETHVEVAQRLARSEAFPLTFRIEPEPEAKPSSPGP